MNEAHDVLISRYLAADMGPPEVAAFEARLAAEPELAAALQQRQEEQTFLRTEAALPDLQEKMAELAGLHFREEEEASTQVQGAEQEKQGRETNQGTATIRILNWKRWLPAVGFAAAVALVLLIWNPFSQQEPYQQFAAYAPIYLTEKSSDPAPAAGPAEAAFNQQDYAAAYPQLIAYLQQRPDDNEARLALGISALETNRDAEARAIFQELANGNTALQDDGQFYLALAYFKAQDPRTTAALQAVGKNNPDYGVRVERMLQLVQ
ncbi:MAG: hypothetical protein AAF840_12085 [Bacteroidota bacterium]